MMRIEEIDPNFRLSSTIPTDVSFFDPRCSPFSIDGLVPNDQGIYSRLPLDVAARCGEAIQALARHLAGACVRFSTDADHLTVLWKLRFPGVTPHCAVAGQSGMQLFEESDAGVSLVHNLIPILDQSGNCKQEQSASFPLPGGMRSYALYLPLYKGLDELLIGLPPQAELTHGRRPKVQKPILFYGSSITQGGCASKVGSCYTTILCRRLDAPQINLGFAGNAKGEPMLAEYIASVPMSIFVMDYDYNAPTVEHLRDTHEPFFQIVREAQPDLPIVLVSRPEGKADLNKLRSEVICDTYRHAVEAGDKNVYFVNGTDFFGTEERDLCTVDGCHPNDLGFWHMANRLEPLLRSILEKQYVT